MSRQRTPAVGVVANTAIRTRQGASPGPAASARSLAIVLPGRAMRVGEAGAVG